MIKKILTKTTIQFLFIILLVNVYGCSQGNNPSNIEENPRGEQTKKEKPERKLILENATLEQANAQGQILWKLKTDIAVYSKDNKVAQLENPVGNIYQDGELVLQVRAKTGEIYQDGEKVFLRGDITAIDTRNNAIIKGDEVEWQPQEDLFIITENFQVSHAKLKVTALEGKYSTRIERLELIDQIVAVGIDPPLQLKTDHLYWEIPQEKVIGDRPLEILRYEDDKVIDRVVADSSEVNFNNNTAVLKDNVELRSIEPSIQIASNQITWEYENRVVRTDVPIQIVDYQQEITVVGNQGKVDLAKEIAHLSGGTQGTSKSNQAQLYAEDLLWNIPTETVEAIGNVIYQQQEPSLNVTGVKAVGKLNDNTIVVTGDSGDRVFTEIIP